MVLDVLVAVGDHRAPPVPPLPADDVHGGHREGIRGPHHGADVHVVAEVLDRHVQRMASGVEVGDDRLPPPVAVAVDDIAGISAGQQVRVEPRIVRPGQRVRPDADRRTVRPSATPSVRQRCPARSRSDQRSRSAQPALSHRRQAEVVQPEQVPVGQTGLGDHPVRSGPPVDDGGDPDDVGADLPQRLDRLER